MTTIGEGLLAIIWKMLLQIQMYHKKSTNSRVQQSMFMSLYALFISFPVRHTVNFRFDGRHCIGDLMAHTIIRKLLYNEFEQKRFLPNVNQSFRRKHSISQIKRTTRTHFLLEFFIWIFWFPIDIFANSKIEIHLKSHFVVKLPVGES